MGGRIRLWIRGRGWFVLFAHHDTSSGGKTDQEKFLISRLIEVVHSILDAYIILLTSLIPIPIDSTPLTSPHSPSDSQPAAAGTTANQIQNRYLTASFPLPAYWTSSTLTQLKIQLHQSRAEGVGGRGKVDYGFPGVTARDGKDEAIGKMVEGLGKNESTVRFVFA
jgi:hypothetical protein